MKDVSAFHDLLVRNDNFDVVDHSNPNHNHDSYNLMDIFCILNIFEYTQKQIRRYESMEQRKYQYIDFVLFVNVVLARYHRNLRCLEVSPLTLL